MAVEKVDCVVVGAGVVGLAIARRMAQAGREVLILEAEDAFGTQTSSRSSEVIHAGIYYRPDTLIGRICVAGRDALYDFCASHNVPHSRCGKLIVATSDEEADRLDAIAKHAAANGCADLRRIGHNEIRALEPELDCVAALVSPSTGIVDSHALMLAYLGDAEAAGAMLALSTAVVSAQALGDGLSIMTGGAEPMQLHCRLLINAAGHGAPALGRAIAGLDPALVPTAYYAKGNYFGLVGRAPFSRLVYPVPVPGGLGVHLTLDLGGQARFGPDVEWVDRPDYEVDPRRADSFYAAIRRYWPGLRDGHLQPAYAGLRPKIVPKGAPAQDFVIQGPAVHGVAGLVNLFGIESPGLTTSLAIADEVARVAGID